MSKFPNEENCKVWWWHCNNKEFMEKILVVIDILAIESNNVECDGIDERGLLGSKETIWQMFHCGSYLFLVLFYLSHNTKVASVTNHL